MKIFSLKHKTNQILPATIAKIKFCLIKKTASESFRLYLLVLYKHWNRYPRVQVEKGLQCENKTKTIQADLGTFRILSKLDILTTLSNIYNGAVCKNH